MRQFLKFCAVVAVALCVVAQAEAKEKKAKREMESICFITDIDCPTCEKKIMNILPFQKGVKDVVVDLPNKSITVVYDGEKSDKKELAQVLKGLDVKIIKEGER